MTYSYLIYSDLQPDCFHWFLSVDGWDPLPVWPPGPDSSAYQCQRSVGMDSSPKIRAGALRWRDTDHTYTHTCLPQTGCLPVAPTQASWSCGTRSTGTSWPMSTSCGRSHKPLCRPKYDWPLPSPARCPSSIWPPMGRYGRDNERLMFFFFFLFKIFFK